MTTKFKCVLKRTSYWVGIIIFGTVLGVSLQFAKAAWTGPTQTPPDGNIDEPLNTSITGQSKAGGLNLNSGGAINGLIVQKGNVGIGTTAPAQKLDVEGNIRINQQIYSKAAYIGFLKDGGSALPVKVGSLAITSSYANSAAANDLYVEGKIQSGGDIISKIGRFTDFSIGADFSYPRVTFFNNNFHFLRAMAGNHAGLGVRSMAVGNNFANTVPDSGMAIEGPVGIGTSPYGTYTLEVNGTAFVSSGAWSGSDIRWKKDIKPLDNSLDKVMQLTPVSFKWKTDEYSEMHFTNETQLGFIAQDVETIIPEIVNTDKKGFKGISYERITPVLTEAIKEQQKLIEALSEKIERQNKKIEEQEKGIEFLRKAIKK